MAKGIKTSSGDKIPKKKNSKLIKEKKVEEKKNTTFDFNEEIIIGMPLVPKEEPKKPKQAKSIKKKKENKQTNPKEARERTSSSPKSKKENTPNNNKKSKKKKRSNRIIKWSAIILLLIGTTIYLMLSPLFNIVQIEVSGNEKISKDTIISLSGLQIGQNTFKLSKSKTIEAIKTNAYIDSIQIKRKLPSGLQIIVKERKATLQILLGSSYVYLNNQGYFLEIAEQKLELPLLTGLATKEEEIKLGSRLVKEDLQKLETILNILEIAQINELATAITEVSIENRQDYLVVLEQEKKVVHMGDGSNINEKILYLKGILEKEKGIEGEIFLDSDLENSYFREKV